MKVSWEEGVFAIGNVINVSFSFLFFRGHFLNLDFSLGYEGKLGVVFFLPLGMSLTFLFLFFFRGRFLNLDFSLGYEGKLGVVFFFAIGNVINVPFSFFSLGDAF